MDQYEKSTVERDQVLRCLLSRTYKFPLDQTGPGANALRDSRTAKQELSRRRRTAAGFILTWKNTAAHSGLLGVRSETGLKECAHSPILCTLLRRLQIVSSPTGTGKLIWRRGNCRSTVRHGGMETPLMETILRFASVSLKKIETDLLGSWWP